MGDVESRALFYDTELQSQKIIGRKAWTAYVALSFKTLLLLLAMSAVIVPGVILGIILPNVFLGLLDKIPYSAYYLFSLINFLAEISDVLLNTYLPYVIAIYLAVFAIYAYKIAVLRSYAIITNDEGVWVTFGILPWAKGADGVRWADMDTSAYYPDLVGWLCNSYPITVKHKYTNRNDFVITSIWRGRVVCDLIITERRQRIGLESVISEEQKVMGVAETTTP